MVKGADESAVDLRHVAKTYRRRVRALRGIEMRVCRGEIFGLLGPNGAGKTTLVKIMMTVTRPNRAEGTVLGQPIGDKRTLARVGYLPENPRFPGYLTGRQALEFYGALSGGARPARKRRAPELLETVGLTAAADVKVSTYSKGMVQRLGLAQSLINDPQLVLLDEPTDGVDPLGRREIRQVLLNLRRQGKTVFLNSHMLGEVEMICDRVAILVQGLVVRQGTLDELTKDHRFYEIELDALPVDAPAVLGKTLAVEWADAEPGQSPGPTVRRGKLPDGQPVELSGPILRVEGAEAAAVQPVIDALRREEMIIRAVRPVRQSLEELFIETVTANDTAPSPPPRALPVPGAPPSSGGQGGGE